MTITRHTERHRATRRTAATAVVLSILGHLLLLVVAAPWWMSKLDNEAPPPPSERELKIEAVYEEAEEADAIPTPEPEVVELRPEINDAAEARGMMAAAKAPAIPAPAPTPTPTPVPQRPTSPEEMVEVPVEEQSPVIMKKPVKTAQQLLNPNAAMYEQMFAHKDSHAEVRAKELAKGKVLFKNYAMNNSKVRTSLQSFGHAVKPGNHTGVHPKSGAFGSYIGAIHRKIHLRWANGYLMDLDVHEPAGSAMNDRTLNTKLEFVIRAENGEVEAVNIVDSSGQLRFDAQAIAIAHQIGPHPNPPAELVSHDGRVYVHWNFWRDQRQCGTFGASIYLVGEQGGAPG